MGIKVLGIPMSTCTARVLTSLLEKEVDYELVPIDMGKGEHKSPDYLAKHPFGQIPVLQDDDLTLFESRAITSYVSYKYKDQGTDLLRIGNVKETALVGVWIEVESQQYNPAILPIVYQLVIVPMYGQSPDLAIVEAHVEKFNKVLDVYEARLSHHKYLAGDFFSLADLNHFPFTYYLMKTQYASLINDRPHVKAWWESVSSRPAFKKVAENMTLA
ncbi:Glutathione s-transferase [Thalictrum thalictroides]|uniref:glutathione transferase n=1 Tax=Thalictrum thalictroides TaxID=46969 RepID=A0A7J6VBW2_THATH|nr:Glutathione s-transferase [Thalictrum thalictroides]